MGLATVRFRASSLKFLAESKTNVASKALLLGLATDGFATWWRL